MSVEAGNGEVLSESEFLKWLQAKPRTLGWSAWMAYDKATANLSLRRDYNQRLNEHVLAEPVTAAIATVENAHWEHLYDMRFGAPSVSFKDSALGSIFVGIEARAFIGTQLTVERPLGGGKRVVKLEAYSPLWGPKLVGRVALDDEAGAGIAARQVRVDLGVGKDYQLSLAGTYQAQLKGGEFFLGHFAAKPPEPRCCVLNTLGSPGDGLLAPEEVRARAFPAPASENGDGAVLLFVAAKDTEVGSLPDSDSNWVYPIPVGCSTTLLVSNFALMTQVLSQGIRRVATGTEIQFDNPDNPDVPVNRISVSKGTMQVMRLELAVEPFASTVYQIEPALAGEPSGSGVFNITREDGGLRFNWRTSSFGQVQPPELSTEGPDGLTALDCVWKVGQRYQFTVAEDGNLALGADASGAEAWFRPVYRQAGALDVLHYQHFSALSLEVADGMAERVRQRFVDILGAPNDIDQLRRLGLKFCGSQVMQLESAYLPTDLAMFGNVSADPEGFVLEPSSSVVKAGSELQINAVPPQTGLAYTVEIVDGNGRPGVISDNGTYTAPTASEMDGTSITVRVAASKGSSTSCALVHVVVRDIHASPLVFASWPTAGTTRLSAGCVDGGRLEWTIRSASGAVVEDAPVDDVVVYDEGDQVYVPGTTPSGAFFSVDEVTASNPRTSESQTISVLVVEKPLIGEIKVVEDAGLAPNQVQLEFHGGEGPIAGAQWKVQIGGGSVDQSGRYTLDPTASDSFAVITATLTVPGVAIGNYLILPLPLIDLEELKRVLA